ncbi:hypothetical protein BCR34DRAFT_631481 [Clohesyomyces aquaticus]|uniref:Uncharacterized protein n=1 Tax=Clohesyomyces aquaticus TaxID=1231657 RepID=A0A1Y2A523_9PLEO|nr:hypothetical protein BCR34DRAFT_631481 [Clohesyomyces aquaticus]
MEKSLVFHTTIKHRHDICTPNLASRTHHSGVSGVSSRRIRTSHSILSSTPAAPEPPSLIHYGTARDEYSVLHHQLFQLHNPSISHTLAFCILTSLKDDASSIFHNVTSEEAAGAWMQLALRNLEIRRWLDLDFSSHMLARLGANRRANSVLDLRWLGGLTETPLWLGFQIAGRLL